MSQILTAAPDSNPDAALPTTDLPAQFVPAAVEGPLYQRWVERGYFEARPGSDMPPFAVVIPPPNVTGNLHLGHAFEHTLIDALVRRRRMQGYDAVWIPGMDHAGIATQNVVEKQLRAQGLTRHDLGREAFVEKVWAWKEQSGGAILGQMRRLGDGVDWSRERFTMDEGLSRAVQTIFKKLYDDDLIYRAERIINWCPACLTALSDIEVEHHDDEGELVELVYGDADDRIVVATTRVETMLGDTGIAVHPGDQRYARLVGRQIELPLTGRMIPVVADEHVDPDFGTGAVKVTPAHDPNDFEIGRRHGLQTITIMTPEATITGTGTRFDGMDRYEARVAVREALAGLGRVGQQKRPYVHAVGHCSRSGDVIEPRLSLQWFVTAGPLARAAGDAVRDGRVTIHPREQEARWFAWVDSMHDWCISRQLWWGHRIPVWYGPDGQVRCVGPDDEVPGDGWTQDDDVLDTWFSSALWPFSTLGWPEATRDLERYYPNGALVTGYDILFFWVARMMMFGIYANDGTPPFPVVALHGMVRDKFGKKMSKSFGNVVDPMEWLDAYGADALRFTLARGANPGTDVPIGEESVQAGRNFCTKLWNATRFALINGATVEGPLPGRDGLSATDRWILSRLTAVVDAVDAGYEDYQFAKTTETLYHFVWDEVCDWYLELAKLPLAEGGAAAATTRRVLGEVLDVVLRLLHPVAPFVTEELWTALVATSSRSADGRSLVVSAWPAGDPARAVPAIDEAAEAEVAALQRLVTEIRRFRAEQGVRGSLRVPARLSGLDAAGLAGHEATVRSLARLDDAGPAFAPSVSVVLDATTVDLDLSGSVDVAAERNRLRKDLAVAVKERDQTAAKLGNEQFVGKAPDAVVAKIRARQAAAQSDIARLESQLEGLPTP